MQEAVKWQIKHLGGVCLHFYTVTIFILLGLVQNWKEGEVIVSNHPIAGGSHLPDITVMTPVFSSGRPIFYVASRGHHADIGKLPHGYVCNSPEVQLQVEYLQALCLPFLHAWKKKELALSLSNLWKTERCSSSISVMLPVC